MVDQMVEDTTKALEDIVDELWVLWVGRLVPNMACRVRAAAEARAWEEHDHEVQEEAKCLVDDKLVRAAKRDRWLEEKLTPVLEGRLSQAELEVDSEVEEIGEAEGSKAVRMEEVGTTGGTQLSVMEVDEEGEDEVVVVERVKRGETRKQAPSSPPKFSRKRSEQGR